MTEEKQEQEKGIKDIWVEVCETDQEKEILGKISEKALEAMTLAMLPVILDPVEGGEYVKQMLKDDLFYLDMVKRNMVSPISKLVVDEVKEKMEGLIERINFMQRQKRAQREKQQNDEVGGTVMPPFFPEA